MSYCVLGTNRDDVRKAPPCRSCIYQSKTLYAGVPTNVEGNALSLSKSQRSTVTWFEFERDKVLVQALENLNVEELSEFAWSHPHQLHQEQEIALAEEHSLATTLPLGALCLPGLRWILRIHHLNDDEPTRYLLREYILSAWNIAQKFSRFPR